MGRTFRKQKTHNKGKKLTPYLKDKDKGVLKYKADRPDGIPGSSKGISEYDKLIVKNANRSRKKGARQQFKNDLNEELYGEDSI